MLQTSTQGYGVLLLSAASALKESRKTLDPPERRLPSSLDELFISDMYKKNKIKHCPATRVQL